MKLDSGWVLAMAVVVSSAAAASARTGDDKIVTWQGKKVSIEALPDSIPKRARTAIEAWKPWLAKAEYKVDIDADGRTVLVTSVRRDRVDNLTKILTKTRDWFDAFLPAPKRATATKPAEKAAPVATKPADEVPEDPDAPAPARPKPTATASKTEPLTTWGSANLEPDSQAAVMLVLRDNDDYASALAHLAVMRPELKNWTIAAGGQLGFVLESPLCGAYLENAGGQDDPEWSPDHELINRLTQCLTVSRFGQLPYWLTMGIAWEAEMNHDGTIYCYPYRNEEFLSVGEHAAWPLDLKRMFKDRAKEPLSMSEFASWKRGKYENTPAILAWGFTRFLRIHYAPSMSPMLEDFRVQWDRESRKTEPDGTWVRVPGFELPIAAQRAALVKYVDADVLENASTWFAKQEEPKKKGKASQADGPRKSD